MSETTPSDLITQAGQCFDRGDLARATVYFEEAAALAHVHSELENELNALTWMISSLINSGDYQKAVEVAIRLLARARTLDDKGYEISAILDLAIALAFIDLRGRWQEIRPLLLEGSATARQLNDPYQEIQHLMWLGYCAVRMGEETQGFAWLQEALNMIGPDIDMRSQAYYRGFIYQALSQLRRYQGQTTEAVRYAEMAVSAWRDGGYPELVAWAQLQLARAEQARGERGEALRLVEEVGRRSRQQGWKADEQEAEDLRGELERELGHPEVAEGAVRQALKLAQEMKIKEEEVQCLLSLGQILKELSRPEEARRVLKQARELSLEREYEDYFQKAEVLLQTLDCRGII